MIATTEKIHAEYEKVWKTNQHMIDYCMKKDSACYETEKGFLIPFEKLPIETRSCFGYGQNGISTDEDYRSAVKNAECATAKAYFMDKNMQFFKEWDKLLNESAVYTLPSYQDTNFRNVVSESYFWHIPYEKARAEKLSALDIDGLRKIVVSEKEKFRKRLETYWKRYGNTKIKTWTYLLD